MAYDETQFKVAELAKLRGLTSGCSPMVTPLPARIEQAEARLTSLESRVEALGKEFHERLVRIEQLLGL